MKQLSSVGALLSSTVKIYQARWRQFTEVMLLAVVGSFPLVIITAVYYLVNYNNDAGRFSTVNFLLSLLYFAAILMAIYFALSAVIGCYLIAKGDSHVSAWHCIKAARRYFWHFLLVWVMFEIAVMVCGLPLIVIFKLLSGNWLTLFMSVGAGSSFWLGICLAAFLIPMLWATVNFCWAFFAVMEDGWQNIAALLRGRELARGRMWAILLRLAAFFAVWLVIYCLLTAHWYWSGSGWLYTGWSIVSQLMLIATAFVFAPSLIIYGRQIYTELVDYRPDSKLKSRGSKVFIRVSVVLGCLFLLLALVNTVYNLNSGSVFQGKITARDRQRLIDVKTIQSALASYHHDQNKYPDWLVMGQPLADGAKIYLDKLPSNSQPSDGDCPAGYEYTYYSIADGQDYLLSYCLGGDLSADPRQLMLTAGEHKVGQNDLIY